MVPMSLSPRPETLTMMMAPSSSSAATLGSAAMAWALSSAQQDPFGARQPLEAGQRLVVGDRQVLRAAGVLEVRVLGADAGVVEAGRDRVRLGDLALRRRTARTSARRAARPRGPVPASPRGGRCRSPSPAASTPKSVTLGVGNERVKQPDRVGAAAHAGDAARRAGGPPPPGPARAPRGRSRPAGRAPASDTGAARRPMPISSGWSRTLVTQSRSASFIASLSVAVPSLTGCTFAPSSFMRKTFSAWRSTSTAPM